jgi:NitT/TauT family transport system substrate-binding protein
VRRSAFLAAGAAATALAAPARAQSPLPVLRVGATPQDAFAEAYYASDLGFFQRAGLNVQLQTFSSGSSAAPAVSGGAIDVSVTTPMQLAEAVIRGVPFVIVAGASLNTPKAPGALICVAKDGPIREPKDLEGKDVALSTLRTLTHLALISWLTKSGVDVSKVRTVEVTVSQMAASIERGTVAAAFLQEPFTSAAMKSGNLRVLADPMAAIAPRYLQGAWFSTTSFVQSNRDLVNRFSRAIYETGRWANAHHAETLPVLAKYSKLNPDTIAEMTRSEYAERLQPSDLQPVLDIGSKFGFLSRPVSATELIAR